MKKETEYTLIVAETGAKFNMSDESGSSSNLRDYKQPHLGYLSKLANSEEEAYEEKLALEGRGCEIVRMVPCVGTKFINIIYTVDVGEAKRIIGHPVQWFEEDPQCHNRLKMLLTYSKMEDIRQKMQEFPNVTPEPPELENPKDNKALFESIERHGVFEPLSGVMKLYSKGMLLLRKQHTQSYKSEVDFNDKRCAKVNSGDPVNQYYLDHWDEEIPDYGQSLREFEAKQDLSLSLQRISKELTREAFIDALYYQGQDLGLIGTDGRNALACATELPEGGYRNVYCNSTGYLIFINDTETLQELGQSSPYPWPNRVSKTDLEKFIIRKLNLTFPAGAMLITDELSIHEDDELAGGVKLNLTATAQIYCVYEKRDDKTVLVALLLTPESK